MGLVPFLNMGTECSGTVLRVGKGVTRVKPGDRVMCITTNCYMNKAYVWEGCCLKIPKELEGKSLVDIMACNVVFATAIMSLMHIARLQKGEVSSLRIPIPHQFMGPIKLTIKFSTSLF